MEVSFDRWPYPRRAAHRGGGVLAPENTLAAFRVGASRGYRFFEFDVKLSGDGVAVLMHDDTVDRTTDGHGRVAAMRFGELSRLDAGKWHSSGFAGEAVPTLARVAEFLRASRLHANIEIKPCPGREAETGAAVAREARALWRDAEAPPLLSSFSGIALGAAAAAAPELPRALLVERLDEGWLEHCRALACVAIVLRHDALTREVLARAHEASLRVLCYTVNDPARAEELAGWGVDGVITDAIDLIAAA